MDMTVQPHWAAGVLKQQPIPACARLLNVSTNYLRSVLNGHYQPSRVLERRIETLVEEIKDETSTTQTKQH